MGSNIKKKSGNELLTKDKQCIWHPFTPLIGSEENLVIERAEGAILYSEDGREIIDAIASWWVNLHGHSNPHIAQAIANQAKKLEHVMFAGAVRTARSTASSTPKEAPRTSIAASFFTVARLRPPSLMGSPSAGVGWAAGRSVCWPWAVGSVAWTAARR